MIDTTPPPFRFGFLKVTPGALRTLTRREIEVALDRHGDMDWGEVAPEDREANDEAVRSGGRLLSAYRSAAGTKFLVVTEADQSTTTFLLPEEY